MDCYTDPREIPRFPSEINSGISLAGIKKKLFHCDVTAPMSSQSEIVLKIR